MSVLDKNETIPEAGVHVQVPLTPLSLSPSIERALYHPARARFQNTDTLFHFSSSYSSFRHFFIQLKQQHKMLIFLF